MNTKLTLFTLFIDKVKTSFFFPSFSPLFAHYTCIIVLLSSSFFPCDNKMSKPQKQVVCHPCSNPFGEELSIILLFLAAKTIMLGTSILRMALLCILIIPSSYPGNNSPFPTVRAASLKSVSTLVELYFNPPGSSAVAKLFTSNGHFSNSFRPRSTGRFKNDSQTVQ